MKNEKHVIYSIKEIINKEKIDEIDKENIKEAFSKYGVFGDRNDTEYLVTVKFDSIEEKNI